MEQFLHQTLRLGQHRFELRCAVPNLHQREPHAIKVPYGLCCGFYHLVGQHGRSCAKIVYVMCHLIRSFVIQKYV